MRVRNLLETLQVAVYLQHVCKMCCTFLTQTTAAQSKHNSQLSCFATSTIGNVSIVASPKLFQESIVSQGKGKYLCILIP